MAIKGIVDNLDSVPEELRSHYIEAEGGHRLDVEDMLHDSEVAGLRTTLGQMKGEKKELKKVLGAFKSLGMEPDELSSSIEELARFRESETGKTAEELAAEKIEAVKAQMLKKHQAELAAYEEKVGALSSRHRQYLTKAAAAEAINKAGGLAGPLLPLLMGRMDIADDDSVFMKGDDGNPLVTRTGQNMTPTEYLEDLKQQAEFRGCFQAPKGSGSGSPSDGAQGRGGSVMVIKGSDPNYHDLVARHSKGLADGSVKLALDQ